MEVDGCLPILLDVLVADARIKHSLGAHREAGIKEGHQDVDHASRRHRRSSLRPVTT
jgi:hypothetical protein